MDELDKIAYEILDANADKVRHHEEVEARMPASLRFCSQCGDDLVDAVEAEGEDVGDDEYITMVSIEPGKVGEISYVCGGCCHGPLPGDDDESDS